MHRIVLLVAFLLWPTMALAHPVINELLWMGSDVSTSDEWVELFNPDEQPIDLSGWSLSVMSSKGQETVVVFFETGTVLEAGEFLIIARKSGASSALEDEPLVIASSLSLLNTGLLVRLRDAAGFIVDEADDGIGAPFAGENPSGTGAKASMERINPLVPGTQKDNWRTATTSEGFDLSSRTRGTPGFINSVPTLMPDDACTDDLEVGIAVQSGPLLGIGKVTLNLQAVALKGALPANACRWSYGDGFQSVSCNPPSHTFLTPGSYTIHLEVTNACGKILAQDQQVEVLLDTKQVGGGSAWYDGSRLMLKAVLPNPEGADTGKEWVEIRNPEDRGVSLAGWKLKVGETGAKWHPLSGDIGARSTLRIYGSEAKFTLPNTATEICLVPPTGACISRVAWKTAEQDRDYFPTDLREITVRGTVLRAIGSTVLEVQMDPAAASVSGEAVVYVKLLGLQPFSMTTAEDQKQRLEYLEALTKGKKVELEFDTEMWDELGRLLAYASTDQQLSLQEQLLVSGMWRIDRNIDFTRKELFVVSEKIEVVAQLFSDATPVDTAVEEEPETVVPIAHDPRWESIRFSEIFPSPSPASSDGLAAEEWLELSSDSLEPLSLSGFILQTGKKKKTLGSALFVHSDNRVVVSMTSLKLALKNDGDTVSLLSPSGLLLDSMEYPKIAHGSAYAIVDGVACITDAPTPAEENVCSRFVKSTKKTAKKRAAVSPAVRGYAAFYAAQARREGASIEFAPEEKSADGFLMLFLAFGLGLGFGVVPMVLRRKRE